MKWWELMQWVGYACACTMKNDFLDIAIVKEALCKRIYVCVYGCGCGCACACFDYVFSHFLLLIFFLCVGLFVAFSPYRITVAAYDDYIDVNDNYTAGSVLHDFIFPTQRTTVKMSLGDRMNECTRTVTEEIATCYLILEWNNDKKKLHTDWNDALTRLYMYMHLEGT